MSYTPALNQYAILMEKDVSTEHVNTLITVAVTLVGLELIVECVFRYPVVDMVIAKMH